MIRAFALMLAMAVPAGAQQANVAPGALLRGLDKVSGEPSDIAVTTGGMTRYRGLQISMGECRYPNGNPSGDAYAYLSIVDTSRDQLVFEGWMIASAPALSAMDHPRYDVWVLRCQTS